MRALSMLMGLWATSTGCAMTASGAVGLTVDTEGNVGVMAKVGGTTGFELTPHERKETRHLSMPMPGFDFEVAGGYDFGRGSPALALGAHLLGVSVVDDPSRFGMTAGIGLRFVFDDSGTSGGPSAKLALYRTLEQTTKEGCQPGEAAQSYQQLGLQTDFAWLLREPGPARGLFFAGPSYQYFATWALCFSERQKGPEPGRSGLQPSADPP